MDSITEIKKEKAIILGKLIIYKKDLLRALSWIDFLPENELKEKDKIAAENIVKLVNYITRNDG